MIIINATGTVHAANRDAFINAATTCIHETRKEKGCIAYDMFESQTAPNSFVFVERWETQAAIDHHFTTPHLGAFFAAVGAFFTAPPIIDLITPAKIETR